MTRKKSSTAKGSTSRGFSTVSIPSKNKAANVEEVKAEANVKKIQPLPIQAEHFDSEGTLNEVCEKERRKEALLSFWEEYRERCLRNSTRQIDRFLTDLRVTRSQVNDLDVTLLFTDEWVDKVLELERTCANEKSHGQRAGKQSISDEVLAKFWTLHLSFKRLGVCENSLLECWKWAINFLSDSITASDNVIWGFQECFEWFCLNFVGWKGLSYNQLLRHFEALTVKSGMMECDESLATFKESKPEKPMENVREVDVSKSIERNSHVEDLEEVLEPENLIPAWVEIQSKLLELSLGEDAKESREALEQLKRRAILIEKDVLFDDQAAGLIWRVKRIALMKELGHKGKRKKQAVTPTPTMTGLDSDNDEALLSSLFEESTVSPQNESQDDYLNDITIWQSDKSPGLPIRRILSDYLHSRLGALDCRYTIELQMEHKIKAPGGLAFQHSVSIIFSKFPKTLVFYKDIPAVEVRRCGNELKFWMKSVATYERGDSENYISTAVLFAFAAVNERDKVANRLGACWRALYNEFAQVKRVNMSEEAVVELLSLDDTLRNSIIGINEISKVNEDVIDKLPAVELVPHGNSALTTTSFNAIRNYWNRLKANRLYNYMLNERMKLPVSKYRDEIVKLISEHKIVIVSGETGSGKSTQIPGYLFEHELNEGRDCRVICTEPRRISAISLARRVNQELGGGDLVGYVVRFESNVNERTRLIYCTIGIVFRMLESDKYLGSVTHLIIDEVHERSLERDFLLVIVKELVKRRQNLRVVLMSATLNMATLSSYMGEDCGMIGVPGRTFPVEVLFVEDAIERFIKERDLSCLEAAIEVERFSELDDEKEMAQNLAGADMNNGNLQGYSASTIKLVRQLDEYGIYYGLIRWIIREMSQNEVYSHYSRAFLIFMPGVREIERMKEVIEDDRYFESGWKIFKLYSSMSSIDQEKVFAKMEGGYRKIVIATNVAESGITINDITCVIDSGKHKEMRYDEKRGISSLREAFISRWNAMQRRGRAGRVGKGICFHMFTHQRFTDYMKEEAEPEILRLSLQGLIMRVPLYKALFNDDPTDTMNGNGDTTTSSTTLHRNKASRQDETCLNNNVGAVNVENNVETIGELNRDETGAKLWKEGGSGTKQEEGSERKKVEGQTWKIEKVLEKCESAPAKGKIARTISQLIEMGVLEENEEKLTFWGLLCAQWGMDPRTAKVLMLSIVFSMLDFGLTIASILSVESGWISSVNFNKLTCQSTSDLLTVYAHYCRWKASNTLVNSYSNPPKYSAYKCPLSLGVLTQIDQIKSKLTDTLVNSRFLRHFQTLPVSRWDSHVPDVTSSVGDQRHTAYRISESVLGENNDNSMLQAVLIVASFYPSVLYTFDVTPPVKWYTLTSSTAVRVHFYSQNYSLTREVLSSNISLLTYIDLATASTNAGASLPVARFTTLLPHTVLLLPLIPRPMNLVFRSMLSLVSLYASAKLPVLRLRFTLSHPNHFIALRALHTHVSLALESTLITASRQPHPLRINQFLANQWLNLYFELFAHLKQSSK